MRVIAGEAKGRKLKAPRGNKIRPTSDRVKEALFNIIAPRVAGSMFLDLYAGTGNVGIEALSRGCSRAVFVENDPVAIRFIKYNLKQTCLFDRAKVICADVQKAFDIMSGSHRMFDIIFLDPPYFLKVIKKDIERAGRLLNGGGILVLESNKNAVNESNVGNLKLTREEHYGDTKLAFYNDTGK